MSSTTNSPTTNDTPLVKPKAFISYSWTSPAHQAMIKQLAERLLADGVDVVMDIFDFKEGHDKYVFMEKMVTDPSVTHVLVICDRVYARKANERMAGVGTESQIISKEIYERVEQLKFIPVAFECEDDGEWCLPVFLKSRKGVNFTTPEAINENWESLIRLLYGKPQHVKPAIGKPPSYLLAENTPTNPVAAKLSTLKYSVLNGKVSLEQDRRDFVNACIDFIDALRIRKPPTDSDWGLRVIADCGKLKTVRDHIVDWVLLEAACHDRIRFKDPLINFLETILEMKSRPKEMSSWNSSWFDAHRTFAYEVFIYIIASLIKVEAFDLIHEVLTTNYLQPETERVNGKTDFASFECFWAHSEALQALATGNARYISPAAELIRRQANRPDLPFQSLQEAELVILLMAFISPTVDCWYPGTLVYRDRHGAFPFFLRATQHRGFQKLVIITGITNVEELRLAVVEGEKRLGVDKWQDFRWHDRDFTELMNLARLNSLK